MSLLYHGSYTVVKTPLIKAGRKNLDFGAGFYMTRLIGQAEKWAKAVASRYPGNKGGVVTEYEIDDAAFTAQNICYKVFAEYDGEWLDFVVACRHGKDITSYDIVEGGMADDQVIDTVEDYENGRITAEQALDQLRFTQPNNQICVRNQSLIDSYLHYVTEHFVLLENEAL